MESVTRFITSEAQAQGERAEERGGTALGAEVPGLQLHDGKEPKRRIAPKALERFKERVRELTRRTRGVSLEAMVEELGRYLGLARLLRVLRDALRCCEVLDSWIQAPAAVLSIWKQWKRASAVRGTAQTGRGQGPGRSNGGQRSRPVAAGDSPALHFALPNAFFDSLGLPSCWPLDQLNPPNRRVRTRTHGGVTGKAGDGLPMSIKKSQPGTGGRYHAYVSPFQGWSSRAYVPRAHALG